KSVLLLISVILLIVFGLDGKITKNDGLMLLIMLAIYMYTNYKSVADENKKISKSSRKKENTNVSELIGIGIFFVLGLIMMVVGSRLLVENGVKIAQVIGIPQGVISLTVIALGTSLPELVSSITAIKKKHHAISVGNVLGANILNIVSVIGISAIPNNIPILSQTMKID
ncbi:sodium:calcium antiporter, partial [Clostridium tertium]